jgi:glycerol kinase
MSLWAACGLWLGMSLDTERRDLVQALLEGVALRAAEVIRAMGEFAVIGERVSIDGGVSVNPYFCQFLANILGHQVSVNAMVELTALGTATLAAGRELEVVAATDERRDYLPEADMTNYLDRFQEAVVRARNWRN